MLFSVLDLAVLKKKIGDANIVKFYTKFLFNGWEDLMEFIEGYVRSIFLLNMVSVYIIFEDSLVEYIF